MFKAGEAVIYGTQGVCKITEITEKDIGGKVRNYYCLKPLYQSNNTVFVPTDNKKLTDKMKRILSADETKELICAIPDEKTVWIEDDAKRNEKYREILSSGDRYAIIRVIKTLYQKRAERQKCGRRLHHNDEAILADAENILHGELASVLNIPPEQVIPFLTNEIEKQKRSTDT